MSSWVTFRSRRDPAFWAPIALVALPLVPLGLVAHWWITEHLRALQDLAVVDPDAAAEGAAQSLRWLAWSACGLTAAFSVYLFRLCQVARAERRLPPSGWWSLGAYRARVGETAYAMAGVGIGLAVLLGLCGAGLVLVTEALIGVM